MGRAGRVRTAWTWATATSRRRLLLLTTVGVLVVMTGRSAESVFDEGSDPPPMAVSMSGRRVTGDISPLRDPFLVRDGVDRYLFSTGEGVPIRRSDDGRHWELSGAVFPDGLPDWTADVAPGVTDAWAPSLAYFEGRWHLYYSVSIFGTWTSAIGLATSATLDPDDPAYGWTDRGPVVGSDHDEVVAAVRTPGSDGAWNAIDPYPVQDGNGDPWLAWGSFAGGIYLQRIDPVSGRLDPEAEVHHLARRPSAMDGVEAAALVERDGSWYLFTSWDFCCRGVESTYNVRVGRADRLTGPYADQQGQPLVEGGGSLVLGSYGDVVGPGHATVLQEGEDDWYLVHHFYDASAQGAPTLSIRPLLWTSDGWPVAADPGFAPADAGLSTAMVAGSWEIAELDPGGEGEPPGPVRFDLDAAGGVGAGAGVWRLRDGVVEITARLACDRHEQVIELFVDEQAGVMHGRTRDGVALRAHRIEPTGDPMPSC